MALLLTQNQDIGQTLKKGSETVVEPDLELEVELQANFNTGNGPESGDEKQWI